MFDPERPVAATLVIILLIVVSSALLSHWVGVAARTRFHRLRRFRLRGRSD